MKIKRTELAEKPRSTVWVDDPYSHERAPMADTAYVGEYPTHSPVLGPDGRPIEYETRLRVGFHT